MFKFCCEDCGESWYVGNPRTCKCPNEELQQPKQEQVKPVPWEQFHEHMAGPNYVAPQRTWIGLTKEEINQGLLRSFYVLEKARAWRDGVAWAEEILKRKNT